MPTIELISQPTGSTHDCLGDHLCRLFMQKEFDSFYAAVAYVKLSGVSRLVAALKDFRNSGGKSSMVVGVDQYGTSRQGLELLVSLIDTVSLYHDSSLSHTFHPKVYIFEQTAKRAVAIVGSGNLTLGGLFNNHEIHTKVSFDLSSAQDQKTYSNFVNYFKHLNDTSSPCVLKLTPQNLSLAGTLLADETAMFPREKFLEDEAQRPSGIQPTTAFQLFGTVKTPNPPPPDIKLGRKNLHSKKRKVAKNLFVGFWKILSENDASRSSSPGQIQIPIRFREFFPTQRMTRGPDTGGRGRQWEVSCVVHLKDGETTIPVSDARFIVYEPRTGHPRPNTECRFTFRNSTILARLRAGDILFFQPTSNPGIAFKIERIQKNSPKFQVLYKGGRERWGLQNIAG